MYVPDDSEAHREKVYQRLSSQGYTQEEIGEEFNISKKSVWHYLRGKDREIPLSLWTKMCEHAGYYQVEGGGGDGESHSQDIAYFMPLDNAERPKRVLDKVEVRESYDEDELDRVRSFLNKSGSLHKEIARGSYVEYDPSVEYEGAGYYLVQIERDGAVEPVKLRRLSSVRWEIETHLREDPYHLVRNDEGDLVNDWGDVVHFKIVGRVRRYAKESP